MTEPTFPAHLQSGVSILVVTQWLFLMIAYGLVMRNIYLRRWDRRGAWRLTAVVFIFRFASMLFSAHHSSAVWEFEVIFLCMALAIDTAFYAWTNYVALEPIVRRYWPELLISWSRLLGGRFTDPRVGADLLVGSLSGIVCAICFRLYPIIDPEFAGYLETNQLLGAARAAGLELSMFTRATLMTLYVTFILVVLRALFRRSSIAIALLIVLFGVMNSLLDSLPINLWPLQFAQVALVAIVWTRFGVLSVISVAFVGWSLSVVSITTDPSRFYFANGIVSICFVLVVVAFGFISALGGWQKLARPERVAW